jgi:hypothetical protein
MIPARLRRLAHKHGFVLRKSRQSKGVPHANNYGRFMLVEADSNRIIVGSRFDASLEEIENCLKRVQQEQLS